MTMPLIRPSTLLGLLSIPALAAAVALAPAPAQACGGTFCDQGPTAMPVDQTGENILFHIGEGFVEAHIQIQIDPETPAEQFAWVIPVTAVPEFEVGSQILFDNMLNGSVPSYGMMTSSDFCGDDDGFGDEGGTSGDGLGGDGDGDTGGTGGPETPEVVFEGSVGAYEIAVLDGGTVEGVMQWLGDNGYQQDPASEPILAEYLAEEFLFVALKLGVEAGVDEVHPITLRYDGQEPCVPLRLTRIAAAEDMDIRAFFLQDARVVPTNYRHVLVNPLKIDWFNNAANYKEVISMAVDAEQADGNAFVTEYAGDSNVISLGGVHDFAWDSSAYAALVDSPVGVTDLLMQQNLLFCDVEWDMSCTALHPLVQPLLDQYVPVPQGIDPVAFYDCMECYADLVDLVAWDAAAFSAMIDERIFKPGLRAFNLVQDNAYLSRMYTTISPAEMNEDPVFRQNDTLPEVAATRWANQTLHCNGGTTVTLPDDREIYFPPGEPLTWPDFQDEMPWEEDVDQENMADNAPLISLVDNTEEIDKLLEDWNRQKGVDTPADNALLNGCSCSAEPEHGAGGVAFGLMALGMLGLVRRRRR